jgi:FkbM family methyltransferase
MQLTTIVRDGFTISFFNTAEFVLIYHDIFCAGEHDFGCARESPTIIDAGAHIGLATLFFKRRYPRARIVAVEPNPTTFALLERNVRQNRLGDVRLVQAALAATPGCIPLYVSRDTATPWSWGDAAVRNAWYSEESTQEIVVPAVTLSSLLTQPVDLLKLDIEGLETTVLAEAAPRLHLGGQIDVEFHGSHTNPSNRPERVLSILREHDLAYTVRQGGRIIDERRFRGGDPYWLTIRARRLSGGRIDRFVASRSRLHRLRARLSDLSNEVRKTWFGPRLAMTSGEGVGKTVGRCGLGRRCR